MQPTSLPFLRLVLMAAVALSSACGNDTTAPATDFLDGTPRNPQIGLVVNSTGKALTLFQLGNPTETRQASFGPSSEITPTGLAVRGTRAAVPLGNAASVALVNLENQTVERFFTFPSGNATGVAFANDTTILAANLTDDYLGKITLDQSGTAITQTVPVAPAPTAVVIAAGRAFVISGNLDADFKPLGNGIVTAVDPATLQVLGTVSTGGTNSSAAAVGPDGRLYVVNTKDFVANGSVTIIDPVSLSVVATVDGFGPGPGAIHIDRAGLAYISSFGAGTVIWNTKTHAFVRGPANPVCAPIAASAGGGCRGAFDATSAADGSLYQAFFGSASQSLAPYVFVYAPNTYQLVDSVSVGVGPAAIEIATFNR